MAEGFYNGNKVITNNEDIEAYNNKTLEWPWRYKDGQIANKPRPCPHCCRLPLSTGEDGCLGHLPGVKFACCGHGREGYIVFENGVTLSCEKLEVENENPLHT